MCIYIYICMCVDILCCMNYEFVRLLWSSLFYLGSKDDGGSPVPAWRLSKDLTFFPSRIWWDATGCYWLCCCYCCHRSSFVNLMLLVVIKSNYDQSHLEMSACLSHGTKWLEKTQKTKAKGEESQKKLQSDPSKSPATQLKCQISISHQNCVRCASTQARKIEKQVLCTLFWEVSSILFWCFAISVSRKGIVGHRLFPKNKPGFGEDLKPKKPRNDLICPRTDSRSSSLESFTPRGVSPKGFTPRGTTPKANSPKGSQGQDVQPCKDVRFFHVLQLKFPEKVTIRLQVWRF